MLFIWRLYYTCLAYLVLMATGGSSLASRSRNTNGKGNDADGSSVDWPDSLDGFGYKFYEDGVLRDDKGKGFDFMHFDNDHAMNQARYENLGETITKEIYKVIEEKGELKRRNIPLGARKSTKHTFIFVSDDLETNAEKLLILIHGSGVVRAGQWTRKLIINNSLDHGSQLPYINRAKVEGYAVVVLNTNDNYRYKKHQRERIPHSGSPEEHARYVWENVIRRTKAKKVAIMAHSYGGVVTVDLARKFQREFQERVFAIAFTDSVHYIEQGCPKPVRDHLQKVARNWVTSDEPLNSKLKSYSGDAVRVSAGDTRHEWTSYSSYEEVFDYLLKMENPEQAKQVCEEESVIEDTSTEVHGNVQEDCDNLSESQGNDMENQSLDKQSEMPGQESQFEDVKNSNEENTVEIPNSKTQDHKSESDSEKLSSSVEQINNQQKAPIGDAPNISEDDKIQPQVATSNGDPVPNDKVTGNVPEGCKVDDKGESVQTCDTDMNNRDRTGVACESNPHDTAGILEGKPLPTESTKNKDNGSSKLSYSQVLSAKKNTDTCPVTDAKQD